MLTFLFTLQCFEPWWWDLMPAACVSIVIYVIGIPLGLCFFLVHYRHRLENTQSVWFARLGIISSRYSPGMAWYKLTAHHCFCLLSSVFLFAAKSHLSTRV